MTIGIIILCRYNSSRLPGKILMEIGGESILQRIYNRINRIVPARQIVVATSTENSDDPIADYCQARQIQCFRGDLKDVAGRFLAAAEAYDFDFATRINGDNLFVDLETLSGMLEVAQSGSFDFVTNVEGRTFPYGMSIEIVKVDFFKKLYQQFEEADYKEHVTLYLYHNKDVGKRYNFYNTLHPRAKGIQLAIDEPADYERAIKIINKLQHSADDYSLTDICNILEKL